MPLTYSEVMSRTAYLRAANLIPYTGYNAVLYARWLPSAVFIPIFAAVSVILSLFLPWFYVGNIPLASVNTSLFTYTGWQMASSGAYLFLGNSTFSFPLLWSLVFLSIALTVLSLFLLKEKVFTSLLTTFTPITFGLMLLVEVVYWISCFIATQPTNKGGITVEIQAGPSSGLWVSMLVTLIAGGMYLILHSSLSWSWLLAQEDVEEVGRRTQFKPIVPEHLFQGNPALSRDNDIGVAEG